MTILVAYVPRPEGWEALNQGITIAKQRNEVLLVVNASPGGVQSDSSLANSKDAELVEQILVASNVKAEFKQFVRGKSPVEEIQELVDTLAISLVVIGIRKRSAVGKLLLGSTAQELLLSLSCPVLTVKAP